ncbi:MAG: hypothetical protein WC249_02520 [Patescibacteria group bacterium]|jgi:hypothetical protein
MDLQDITKDLAGQENYRIARRLEELMQTNPKFRNLDESNREVILKLVNKYKEKIRLGIKPSLITIREDKYHLYENRIKLGLTPTDLGQINKLLDSFKQ